MVACTFWMRFCEAESLHWTLSSCYQESRAGEGFAQALVHLFKFFDDPLPNEHLFYGNSKCDFSSFIICCNLNVLYFIIVLII